MVNSQEQRELEQARYYQSMGESLNNLKKNPDFIKVILDGYMKDKALDSVSLLANEQVKAQGQRNFIIEDLMAISNLEVFFNNVENLAYRAEEDLEEFPEEEV